MEHGHFVKCSDCLRRWDVKELPEDCRWSECWFVPWLKNNTDYYRKIDETQETPL